jgi:hypothetical protein
MNNNTTINRISYTIYNPEAKYYYSRHIDVPKDHEFTLREAQLFIDRHFLSKAIVTHLHCIESGRSSV